MPQFGFTNRNPAYAQGAANLSEALFGAPQSVENTLREELLAKKAGIAGNELYGQNQFRDMLEGVNGDLNNVDGGSLAAAIGLANINPRALTALSLDPRHGEMDQRRANVASGANPSIGSLAADIGLINARTNLVNKQTANIGKGGGSGGFKPPQLVPKNVAAIREAALAELGLDEGRLQNTIQQNESLGTAILDMISKANTEGMGNAAYTQGRVQEMLSNVIGEETGGWQILPGTQGPKRYEVNQDALSSILNGSQAASAPQQPAIVQDVNPQDAVQQARQAIMQGRDPDMVLQRLLDLGIEVDPEDFM